MSNPELGKRFRRKEQEPERKPRVTIVGRFRYKDVIDETIGFFEEQGIEVPAPPKGQPTGEEIVDFKLLEGDTTTTEEEALALEMRFIEAMLNSDAVYLVNPTGTSGISSLFELGVAAGHGVPIYAMHPLEWEEPEHPTFQKVVQMIPIVPKEEIPSLAKTAMKQNKRGKTVAELNKGEWRLRRV